MPAGLGQGIVGDNIPVAFQEALMPVVATAKQI